jgi:hypothetical protein
VSRGQPGRHLPGDRVELTAVSDDYARLALTAGEAGTVEVTDSLGTVHIRWDSGARIGIIVESADCLRKIGGPL